MSIALDLFCLTLAATMPSAAELSVLIEVGGRGKSISRSMMWRGTDVFPMWNSPPASDSAADAITCFMILHSVWIGTFAGGRRFGYFSGSSGSELR